MIGRSANIAGLLWVRILLALSLLVFVSLQSVMASASAPRAPVTMVLHQEVSGKSASLDAAHELHSQMNDMSPEHSHAGKQGADDQSCEVHCAPLHAFPASFSFVGKQLRGGHEARNPASLRHGEYVEFIRPPRSLQL